MSEPTEAEVVVDEVVEVEVDPYEEKALEQHWLPKDEWVKQGKSEVEWRPAKEFVERGEIFKSLHQVKRELKQERVAREALQKHHQYVFERARQQAIQDLRKERRLAIRENDVDKAEQIEDEIVKQEQQFAQERQALITSQQVAQTSGVPPEFDQWKSVNTWYDEDTDLHDFADASGLIYINKNPNAAPAEVLRHIDAKMRKQFPDKFGVRRGSPSPTVSSDRTNRPAKKSNDVFLDEMETAIMKTLVASGDLTEAQYKAEIKKSRG